MITERKIIDNAIASEKEVNDIKEAINLEIDEAMAFAEASDYPLGSELYEDNYMQKDYPFIMD